MVQLIHETNIICFNEDAFIREPDILFICGEDLVVGVWEDAELFRGKQPDGFHGSLNCLVVD